MVTRDFPIDKADAIERAGEPTMNEGLAPTADVDTVYQILRDRTRRRIVRELAICGEPPSVSELTEALAEERDALGDSEERTLSLRLYHLHLPKMASSGVVEYDDDAVALTPAGTSLAEVEARIARVLRTE